MINSLKYTHPKLAEEWHPTKNGDLTTEKVTAGSEKKVWWIYPYDDPATGKHFDFEWKARIGNRANGRDCPFLSGYAVWPGFNDLRTTHPDIAAQWHPTKNGNLTPEKVTAGSGKKVWWIYPYDDPATGRRVCFEWKAQIYHRANGHDCPFLRGYAVWPGFNDLRTTHPDLAAQWHPTKNGNLTPGKVTAGSVKKVWWIYPYDDPTTRRRFYFEWKAQIRNRANGHDCPFLSGNAVWPGFNDLRTTHPDLAAQWHPTKNGNLTSEKVSAGSNKIVWWIYPYDDPTTRKHFDFEWQAQINRRTSGQDCPFLSGNAVWPGFNDLRTTHPDLVAQWHPTKNGDLTPEKVSAGSVKKVWWIYPYDDRETGKHFDFEWQAKINSRTSGNDCPFLRGKSVWPKFNNLRTTHPDLAAQWHLTKNGNLTPEKVTAGSGKKVWWIYPYDDPETGKHFDFEWQAQICRRTSGQDCPFLSGYAVWPGFNDLRTTHPDLAAQWHPTKNGDLTPEKVTSGSGKKVWWIYPYDDPETGKRFDFEWQAKIYSRAYGQDCPFLSGHAVWSGFNDLRTTHPDLAIQWHPTKNGDLTPEKVREGSKKKVWWFYPYDDPATGKHFDFEWQAPINSRTRGNDCPFLSGHAVWSGFNDLRTTHPKLAAQWHPTKNGDLTPKKVSAGSNRIVWWIYPYDDPETGEHFDFEWQAQINSRTSGNDCPFLSGNAVWPGFNDLLTANRELAMEFNIEKNHGKGPETVSFGSQTKYWWKCKAGHVWRQRVTNRMKGAGCPYCHEELSQ